MRLSRGQLVGVASGVFIAGTSALYYAHFYLQMKVRKYPHYEETFRILGKHEMAQRSLGAPIQIGKINLVDRRRNFVGPLESQFRIPITGSLNGGYLNVTADRETEDNEFSTRTIELDLQQVADDVSAESDVTDQPGLAGGRYLIYERVHPKAAAAEEAEPPPQRHIVIRWMRWLAGYPADESQAQPLTPVVA